jgi:hypothetical protein
VVALRRLLAQIVGQLEQTALNVLTHFGGI